MRSIEDDLFARWCARGDGTALGELFDRVAPRLLALAIHLVGDAAEAEDLVQTTFLAAIESRARLDASRPVMPWLTSVLANKARDARKRAARRVDPTSLSERLAEAPLDELGRRELSAEVARAIDRLGEPYREVLILRLRHGLSIADVAHVLQRSPGTVRVQLHRALEKLRSLLPASLVTLALAGTTARGLAAVRATVLHQAAASVAPAASAVAIGGVLVSQKTWVLGALAAALLGVVGWRILDAPRAREATMPEAVAETAAIESRERASTPLVASPERASVVPTNVATPLRGRVVDAVTEAPLAGAEVAIFAPQRVSLLEAAGRWPELYEVQPEGTIVPRTHADWPRVGEISGRARFGEERIELRGAPEPNETALARTTTDDAGGFTLPSVEGGGVLVCRKDGYGARFRVPGEVADDVTIRLWREREIVGRVVTMTGEPPGERIRLALTAFATPPLPRLEELQGKPRSFEPSELEALGAWTAETDASGAFSARVAADEVDVHVLSPGWRTVRRQRFSCTAPIDVRIRRVPVLRIFDAVTEESIERVRLWARSRIGGVEWSGEMSAPEGILALPGDGSVLDQWAEYSFTFCVWARGYRATTVHVPVFGDATVVDVALEPGECPALEGRVHRGEQACAGAELALVAYHWADDSLLDATRADDAGRFRLSAAPGAYLLRVTHGGEEYFEPIELPASGTIEVDLARTARVEVEIVDQNGVPRAEHLLALAWQLGNRHRDARAVTDANGRAAFAPLPEGAYLVFAPFVSKPNHSFRGDVTERIELSRGETKHVRLVVPRFDGPRRARVVARGVDDYTGWRARFAGAWEPLGADGTVAQELGTSQDSLEIEAPDARRWQMWLPADVPDGHVIELDANDGGYQGVLLGFDGEPKAGVRIHVEPWRCTECPDVTTSTVTDEAGRFALTGLQPVLHRFEFWEDVSARFDGTIGAMTFVPAQPAFEHPELTIRLAAALEPVLLRGVVKRSSDGEPLRDAIVDVECEITGDSGVLIVRGNGHTRAHTDADGRFELRVPRTPTRTLRVYASWTSDGLVLTRTFQDSGQAEEPVLELVVPR